MANNLPAAIAHFDSGQRNTFANATPCRSLGWAGGQRRLGQPERLPNRDQFNDTVPQALARCHGAGLSMALMFLDSCYFKPINHHHGHAGGDQILQEFALRLQRCGRSSDTVAGRSVTAWAPARRRHALITPPSRRCRAASPPPARRRQDLWAATLQCSTAGSMAAMSLRPPNAAAPLAAIDIGSNSFRLEVANLQNGRYRRQAYLKETVRLGGGLDANGYLTESAALRGLDCLARFAERLHGFDAQQVRAVATQTLREARNRDAFLVRAQDALGFAIEVVSGREEARLIYAGVSFLQPGDKPRLVIDIGGRSTEMIVGQGRLPRTVESFKTGSVSLSMRWFPGGVFTEQGFRNAQVAAGAELEEALEPFAPRHWREALGSSGTAGAVSQILAAAGITDGTITPEGLRWCIDQCLAAGTADRLQLPSLREDRKAIIGGGLALLYTLATHFGITALKPAKGALRQGVIIDLHERHTASRQASGGDLRDQSVAALQARFNVDTEQAARVRSVASALWRSALPGMADAGDGDALRELGWACDLHEIGLMVSHHDHHRHSAYLMAHVDAPGFSQSQQRRIGDLVLGQRGGLRKVELQLANERFAWQVLALRLAVIKCHARSAVDAEALQLQRDGRQARLGFKAVWADGHPRTLHLLREEADNWARQDAPRLLLVPG